MTRFPAKLILIAIGLLFLGAATLYALTTGIRPCHVNPTSTGCSEPGTPVQTPSEVWFHNATQPERLAHYRDYCTAKPMVSSFNPTVYAPLSECVDVNMKTALNSTCLFYYPRTKKDPKINAQFDICMTGKWLEDPT